jgi:hypothetical protein
MEAKNIGNEDVIECKVPVITPLILCGDSPPIDLKYIADNIYEAGKGSVVSSTISKNDE